MKAYYLLLALLVPGLGIAQSSNQNNEAEQIIITKKGAAGDKMNIIVDGDKITINGQPVDDSKNAPITVKRRKIKDMDVFNDDVQIRRGRPFYAPDNNFQMQAPNKAMLGVVTQKQEDGVEIVNVNEESAAEKAGLKAGDIITKIDGKTISAPDELSAAIKDKNPGDKVSITYKRAGKTYTTTATLTKWEAPKGMDFNMGNDAGNMPMYLDELLRQMPNRVPNGQNNNRNFRFYGTPQRNFNTAGPKIGIRVQEMEKGDGVKVIDVEKNSPADKNGVKTGDIIKEINGNSIKSPGDASRELRNNRGASLDLKITRNGKTQTINILQESKIKTADL